MNRVTDYAVLLQLLLDVPAHEHPASLLSLTPGVPGTGAASTEAQVLPNTLNTVHPLGPSGEPLRAGVGSSCSIQHFQGGVRTSHGNTHVPGGAEPGSPAPGGWGNWGLADGKRHQVNGVQAGFNKQVLLRPFLCTALFQAWVCFTHEQC